MHANHTRAAAMARTAAFVALRAAEIQAAGQRPSRCPKAVLADLEAGLSAAIAQGQPPAFRSAR